MIIRGKNSRPPKPSAKDNAEKIVRALGRPSDSLLDAILEGVSEEELAEQGRRFNIHSVLDDAFRICNEAYNFWRKANHDARSKIRGFSPQLLAIAVDQTLELERVWAQGQRDIEAETNARGKLRGSFDRALVLRAQARQVLEKVAGDDPELCTVLDNAAGASGTSAALAEAMDRMVRIAAMLLWAEAQAVRSRCALYGLDESYLETLSKCAAELMQTERDVQDLLGSGSLNESLIHRAGGITLLLIEQIVDAFESAHQVDPAIPALHMRLTRKAASLKPVARPASKRRPVIAAKAPAQPHEVVNANPFSGGLGLRGTLKTPDRDEC